MSRLRPAVRRPLLRSLALAAGIATMTACSTHVVEVGFYGNRNYTTVTPALWCDFNEAGDIACPDEFTETTGKLSLRPGDGVVISVPKQVRETSWMTVITYLDADGKQSAARSKVYAPDEALTHTIRMGPGEQLLEVDVQSVTAIAEPDGTIVYQPWRVWILEVQPVD